MKKESKTSFFKPTLAKIIIAIVIELVAISSKPINILFDTFDAGSNGGGVWEVFPGGSSLLNPPLLIISLIVSYILASLIMYAWNKSKKK